jgi:hypothetical protein
MQKATEFLTFLEIYNAVTASTVLTRAEKIAVIEQAFDDYNVRLQPGAYHAIAKRLAALPVKDHAQESNPKADNIAPPPAAPRETKGSVVSRSRRANT